jgi:hypothetical protein
MGAFTSDFLWLYKTTLCSTGLLLHDSFVLAASSKFPLSEFKTLLEGAVVGSVIETNIEGIDRV